MDNSLLKGASSRLQTAATLMVCLLIVSVPLFPRPFVSNIDIVTVMLPLVLLVAVLLLLAQPGRLKALWYRPFGIAAALFLAWGLISILVTRSGVGELLTWARYLSYFLLIFAVGLIASSSKGRTIVLWALVIAGVGAALYGLYQLLNPQIMSDMFAADAGIKVRIYSTFDNPNFFSEFLLLSICGSIALFGRYWKKSTSACAVIIAATLLQLLVLFLTYTRGSLLALAAGLVVGVLVFRPKLVAPLAAIIVLAGLIPPVFARFKGALAVDGTTEFRLGLWRVATTAIREKPLSGGGLGDFYQIYGSVVRRHPALYQGYSQFGAHNSYLQLAAETGIIGGLLFLGAVGSLVWAGIRTARRIKSKRLAFQNAALLAGVVGFILNALTSDSFQHPHAAVYFFILSGLLLGLESSDWRRNQRSAEPAS
ncbi:MAG: O-antigen ligase family protein [Actinomycetia bacterium]|nr:O-antigen ligase family protein [Actinomycetes bacterium]